MSRSTRAARSTPPRDAPARALDAPIERWVVGAWEPGDATRCSRRGHPAPQQSSASSALPGPDRSTSSRAAPDGRARPRRTPRRGSQAARTGTPQRRGGGARGQAADRVGCGGGRGRLRRTPWHGAAPRCPPRDRTKRPRVGLIGPKPSLLTCRSLPRRNWPPASAVVHGPGPVRGCV